MGFFESNDNYGLSKDESVLLDQLVEQWRGFALSTEPMNKDRAIKHVRQSYEEQGFDWPGDDRVFFVDSPHAACELAWRMDSLSEEAEDEVLDSAKGDASCIPMPDAGIDNAAISNFAYRAVIGANNAGSLCYYDFLNRIGETEAVEDLMGIVESAKYAGWWIPFDKAVIIADRPEYIGINEENDLHCEDGKAIRYRDGAGYYFWNGTHVPTSYDPETIFENPAALSASDVEECTNAEIRRVILERMGYDRFVEESGAELVSEDAWGKLWRVPKLKSIDEWLEEEDLCFVEVLNSTPEPDGKFKTYFIPVPPHSEEYGRERLEDVTPKHAIAWTFGETEETYEPSIQT